MARTSKAAAASGSRAVRSGGEGVPASRIGPNPPKSLHPAPARSVYFAVMTAPRERALIRRILAGEKAAAEELISHHQPSLYAYMVRLTGRPETAEDVTQEAFVRALTHLERYDPRFRFSTSVLPRLSIPRLSRARRPAARGARWTLIAWRSRVGRPRR
jgi:hypothetical protein